MHSAACLREKRKHFLPPLACKQQSYCRIGCASHSILNIPQPLLNRAVQSNCSRLSGPDAPYGRSGWCFELPNIRVFHTYNFSVLPLPALPAVSTKTILEFLANNAVWERESFAWTAKFRKMPHTSQRSYYFIWQLVIKCHKNFLFCSDGGSVVRTYRF